MFYPSRAIIVRADTSILDCVRLMKENDVGSVLVVSDNSKQELVGIFTERDLLKKTDVVIEGSHWSRPVRTVMTSPIQTIDVSKISEAPKIMLQNGFRHIPVVYQDKTGICHIAGVVSMRDLFRLLYMQNPAVFDSAKLKSQAVKSSVPVLVLSQDEAFLKLLQRLFSSFKKENNLKIFSKPEELLVKNNQISDHNKMMIVDLDNIFSKKWLAVIKNIKQTLKPSLVIIIFNGQMHSRASLEPIYQMAKEERFVVYSKPMNILAFHERIQKEF